MPVDKATALDLKLNKKLSYAQIAAIQRVTPQAVHKALKNLMPGPEVKTYQENRANILSGLQIKLLSQVDAKRLKKISVRDAVVSAAVLYDKERIETGQSTSNMHLIIDDLEALRQAKQAVPGTQENDDDEGLE